MLPEKRKLFFRWLVPALLALLLLYCTLPTLANRFLLPPLLKNMPVHAHSVRLLDLSLHHLRAEVTLGDAGEPAIIIPLLDVEFSPTGLLHKEIAKISIIGGAVHLDQASGALQLRNLAIGEQKPQSAPRKALVLPFAANTLVLQNTTVHIHRQKEPPLSFILAGKLDIQHSRQPDGTITAAAVRGDLHAAGDLRLEGRFSLKLGLPTQKMTARLQLSSPQQLLRVLPLAVQTNIDGQVDINCQLEFADFARLSNYEGQVNLSRFQFRHGPLFLSAADPDRPVNLQFSGDKALATYRLENLKVSEPYGLRGDIAGEIVPVARSAKGQSSLQVEGVSDPLNLTYQIALAPDPIITYQLRLAHGRVHEAAELTKLTTEGRISLADTGASGEVTLSLENLFLPRQGTTARNVRLQLPFTWPIAEKKSDTGKLQIDRLLYQDKEVGRLEAHFTPTPAGLTLDLDLQPLMLAGPPLHCRGEAMPAGDATMTCRLPQQDIDQHTLAAITEIPPALDFQARLGADAELRMKQGAFSGSVDLQLQDGRLHYHETELDQVNFQLHFPQLPMIATSPAQHFSIGAIRLNKLHFANGDVRFRIENQDTLFIEKGSFSWAGGKVESTSLRVRKDMQELTATLYCDRLRFAELLDQLGIRDTEGDGSLNGRLPVSLDHNGLHVEDGFLFSTPGNSGIVHFGNTDQLRQGLGTAGQSSYLEYTMQALENFAYNWIKISLNTDARNLVVGMQLNGKPAKPLPFGYDNGQIVPAAKGAGLQHPIQLDVNFRFPLADITYYGKNIQSIMENM